MKKKHILIVHHSFLDDLFIRTIINDIDCEFNLPTVVKEVSFELDQFFNPGRRQYNADELIKIISQYHCDACIKTLGVFQVDLFIPILTFLFGQAVFKGHSGVISTFRLRNEQYGLKEDNDLLLERTRKLVIHELGHTFGLVHCFNPNCVMRSSTYVEDIDQKQRKFCDHCSAKLTA